MSTNTLTLYTIQEQLLNSLGNLAPEKDLGAYVTNRSIQEALDIDSFDYLNFLIALESLYGIVVPEADYDQLISLDDVVSYVLERV